LTWDGSAIAQQFVGSRVRQRMIVPKRNLLGWLFAAVVGLCCQASPAEAGAIQLIDVAELSAGGIDVSYPSVPPNPLDIDADGVLLSFSTPIAFSEFDQDGMFAPQFPPGSTLLFNLAEGPLTIDFAPGIREVGFFAQGFSINTPQAFAVNVFNRSTLLKSFSVGPDPNAGFPGTALFIGARAFGLDLITQMTVTNTELSDDPSFVIGPLTFSEVAADQVPEPASLLLLGSGLLAAAARLRQRRTRA
jgi:PEP-CTERM putative exosortase interaction domain